MKKNIPPLFHLSFNQALPVTLYPRQPDGLPDVDDIEEKLDDNIFAEHLPPRISFSPSVVHCWRAIYPNLHKLFTKYGKNYIDTYVYALVDANPHNMLTPEKLTDESKLWDAFYTLEHCFLSKVKVKKIAKVRITLDGEEDRIHPYNREEYKKVKASPPVKVKVLRMYESFPPLILDV